MKTVIVTPRSLSAGDHPQLSRIRDAGLEVVFPSPGKQPSEEQLLEVIAGAVGYLAGVEPITRKVLERAERLKVISRNGTGVDNIDLEVARSLGIVIRRAEGANARGVAELTIGHLLCAARGIAGNVAAMKREEWTRRIKGIEVAGRTLGLVGCGKIGRLVARFALGLDMRVVAADPCSDKSFAPGAGFEWSDLSTLLESSDVISLHCPALADGRALIDRAAIAQMKTGVILINTARSSLLDEPAVIEALDLGKLRSVTVDAFAGEPPLDWRFVHHPQVIATSHIGGYTEESVERATAVAVANLLAELGSERQSTGAKGRATGRP